MTGFGSWRSPITSDLIVQGVVGIGQIALDGSDVYWSEMRPSEQGRYVLVCRHPSGEVVDVTPSPFNVRTRVQEYGGGSFLIKRGVVYFSNFSDQRLYRQNPGEAPQAITPEGKLRFADGVIDEGRHRLICVCEDHGTGAKEAVNSIVEIDLDRSTIRLLGGGHDFFAAPRMSPDGSTLAYLAWDHPNMPWDGCHLLVAHFGADGAIDRTERIAGGPSESIFQPEWSPDGSLYFVSDSSGWWNLYRLNGGKIEPVVQMEAEFGVPQWVFGLSTYAFDSAERIVCSYIDKGTTRLALLDTVSGRLDPIESPYTRFDGVRVERGKAYFVGGSPSESSCLVELDLATREHRVLRRSSNVEVDAGYISLPETIEFPTTIGPLTKTAWGFFYRPVNKDFEGAAGEKPPLIVMSHGGPTAATTATLRLGTQYWTSRGFAVLDVNYGGSTGYGREYRERLKGQWGIVDVDDCVNGALYLARRGDVDPKRLAITGGSAGGYTTLCALAFRDVFTAGASHYGVSDLEALEVDTHKFESQYSHSLVGPYPERKDLYFARSPINFVDRLNAPVIFFQGLEDRIVPPNQAEMMVEALKRKGLPVAYLTFEGEQHGFRQAANIKRALDAQLYFYGRVFGFEPADDIEPVTIWNASTM
jgi:dipeptidyl aminopeptidase/acylaminoacyl peptidase